MKILGSLHSFVKMHLDEAVTLSGLSQGPLLTAGHGCEQADPSPFLPLSKNPQQVHVDFWFRMLCGNAAYTS